jgi:hypothetical protein
MPQPASAAFTDLLAAWNEPDPAVVRRLLEASLTTDIAFVDPHYDIRGIDAFHAMVLAFQAKYRGAKLIRTSGIDRHHDRARYAWAVVFPNGQRFEGFDAIALEASTGRVRRIDGFFGPLPPA